MLNSISFAGRRVFVSPNKKVGNSTASEIAQTINSAYNAAGRELNVPTLKPLRPVSGKSMVECNPDCFDKEKKLTETGKKAFDRVNSNMGVTTNSTMAEYSNAIKNYIVKYFDKGMEGNVCHLFDVLV